MQIDVLDGLLGLAVGDALGVPVEFSSRDDLRHRPVTDMLGYGSHNQPAGTWSDDSSLTFCLAESICHGLDLNDLAQRFIHWYDSGYWTPYGKTFSVGRATAEAIARLKAGSSPDKAGGKTERDNGNGSLMRILPMAYYLLNQPALMERVTWTEQISAVTHAHVRSKIACVFYVEFAIRLLQGCDLETAYDHANSVVESLYGTCPSTGELNHFRRILQKDIAKLEVQEIHSSGYVIHTLEATMWCLLNNNDYASTVLAAVNLGDDTDTTAAVVGGLAGIYYGQKAIPTEWVNQLARKEDVIDLAHRVNLNLGFRFGP